MASTILAERVHGPGTTLRSARMKLATLRDGSRDGRLVVVRFDGLAVRPAGDRWPTLQRALDDWRTAEPALRELAAALDGGDTTDAMAMDMNWIGAPLPRAYEW